MAHDVFISYSSKDKAVADSIVAALENNNIRCWYAPRDIKPSDDWGKAITSAIEESKLFLMIFSKNANHSQRVLDELNFAISEQVTILPFRIENLEPEGAMKLHLSSRHWLDAYDPSWEMHIKNLVRNASGILDTLLDENNIQLPGQIKKALQNRKQKRIFSIAAGILSAVILITAAWFFYTKFISPSINGIVDPVKETETAVASEAETATKLAEENSQCRIIFSSDRDSNEEGQFQLYSMNVDGSDIQQLTFDENINNQPCWSQDGSQIAFVSDRDGDEEIFLMNSNGSFIRKLTDNDSIDTIPWISPSGEKIAFVSDRNGGMDIYLMNIDGSEQTQLTFHNIAKPPEVFTRLDWSPDGEKIVFNSDIDGDTEIYTINVDGSNIQQLTDNEDYEAAPFWSPDGEKIVFESNRYGNSEIFLMNSVGSNVIQLTSGKEPSANARWSPDGEHLLYLSVTDGNFDIWIMDADGSNQTRLTTDEAIDLNPIWSPDCK